MGFAPVTSYVMASFPIHNIIGFHIILFDAIMSDACYAVWFYGLGYIPLRCCSVSFTVR